MGEVHPRLFAQTVENLGHALAHRQSFALDVVMREHVGTRDDVAKCQQHFLKRDLRNHLDDLAFDELGRCRQGVALHALQAVDIFRRFLEALVFLQASYQFGARILFFRAVVGLNPRQ